MNFTEVDGPPQAYFEITDGTTLVRRVYRTLRTRSRETLDDNIDKIRAELIRIDHISPMIFWRARPTTNEDGTGYARLITNPPLSDEFWKSCGHDISGTGYTPP